MRVHEAVIETLARCGAHMVFGLMGDGNLQLLSDVYKHQDLDAVAVSHEAGAVTMAEGYARTSGRVPVVSVTHGPGITNTITPLVEAVRNRTSMIVMTGSTPARIRYFQDIDLRAIANLSGALYRRIRAPFTAADDVVEAVRTTVDQRTPVLLDVPVDIMYSDNATDDGTEAVRRMGVFSLWLGGGTGTERPKAGPADDASLDEAAGILASSRRVVIVAGWGAVLADARDELVTLADQLGAFLATSLRAKDYFRGLPNNLGLMGSLSSPEAVDVISSADCIIAFEPQPLHLLRWRVRRGQAGDPLRCRPGGCRTQSAGRRGDAR